MNWKCKRCGTVHTQNPVECRNCSNSNFRPMTAEETASESTGVESPEPIDPDDSARTVSSMEGGDSSPDVNLDGSIARGDSKASDDTASDSSLFSRFRSLIPFL